MEKVKFLIQRFPQGKTANKEIPVVVLQIIHYLNR